MNVNHFQQFQTFSTKKELDLHVRGFLKKYKWELSDGNVEVLKFIWRHSVKCPGVSFAKIDTIVKKTGRSRSTIIRTINRLEEKKLLKRYSTMRPNGKQGVNILAIQPQNDPILPSQDILGARPVEMVSNQDEPSDNKGYKEISNTETKKKQRIKIKEICKNVGPQTQQMDVSYLPSYIPKDFASAAKPFLTLDEIEHAWECIHLAYQKVCLKLDIKDYMELIETTFKQTIYAWKTGKVKKSLMGYLYGGMIQVFTQQVRREVLQDPDSIYYEWLTE